MGTEQYETLTDAMTSLRAKGFNLDFNSTTKGVECKELQRIFAAPDLEVTETHRFEGATDPADEAVLYALETKDHRFRGLLVEAYGTYASKEAVTQIKGLERDAEKDQNIPKE